MDPGLTVDSGVTVLVPTRQHLAVVWLAIAALLGALLGLAEFARPGLDDADPARQRPGFLDAGSLPQPAPTVAADRPRPRHRLVVFFVRSGDVDSVCTSISADHLVRRADLVMAVAGAGRCDAVTTVADPQSQFARAYGLSEPRSGETPVGYAVVDRESQIRYRTLDPAVRDNMTEIDTVLRAIP